jgi:hypothetical protein
VSGYFVIPSALLKFKRTDLFTSESHSTLFPDNLLKAAKVTWYSISSIEPYFVVKWNKYHMIHHGLLGLRHGPSPNNYIVMSYSSHLRPTARNVTGICLEALREATELSFQASQFGALSIVVFYLKTRRFVDWILSPCCYWCPTIETSSFCWSHLSRFHLKAETESCLQSVVF